MSECCPSFKRGSNLSKQARINEVGTKDVDISSALRWEKDTGEYRSRISQPIQPFVDAAAKRREYEETFGLKKNAEMVRVASLPYVVAMKIKQDHKIDPLNLHGEKEHQKLLQVIQSEYPHLMTTNKRIHRG